MTTIERMQNYIDKTKLDNIRYDMSVNEMIAIYSDITDIFEAISLAFKFGRAKGLREARAEARKNERTY